MLLREERTGLALDLRAMRPEQCCSFSQLADGRRLCRNYNQIRSNRDRRGQSVLDRFAISRPAGILSERKTMICPSLAVLPPTDASVPSYIPHVMGAAMEVASGPDRVEGEIRFSNKASTKHSTEHGSDKPPYCKVTRRISVSFFIFEFIQFVKWSNRRKGGGGGKEGLVPSAKLIDPS